MLKILLVDDEPLVLIGLQSILNWEEHGFEVISTARNGKQAMELIVEHRPDVVITDIKMPLKDGLELCRESSERFGRVPVFIMLTNYEEFDYVRQALQYQAVEYLVKLELDEQVLLRALERAKEILRSQKVVLPQSETLARDSVGALREKFFVRLFNNLFEDDEKYLAQKEELGIHLDSAGYVVASCAIAPAGGAPIPPEHIARLFANTVQTVRETLARFLPSYVVTLDLWHFSIIYCLDEPELGQWRSVLWEAMESATEVLRNYLNVSLRTAFGHLVDAPEKMAISYRASQRCCHGLTDEMPMTFCEPFGEEESDSYAQQIQSFHSGIRQAFEELDTHALHQSLTGIADQFYAHPDHLLEAMDAACNILYMAVSLLPEGVIEQIFEDEAEGYRVLYRMRSVDLIATWVLKLRDGCNTLISTRRQTYKGQVVQSVKAYIDSNLDKRLSLQEVAAVFNFSPNYLSQLFAKYAGEGFVEYITSARVAAAKQLMKNGEGKIYEIAEKLGFESSFYFSKVFKKVEGVSPREYMHRLEQESEGQEA